MNLLLKTILTLSAFLLLGFVSNAQTSATLVKVETIKKCDPTNCNPANCNPEVCKKLVEAGICTPEQMAQCKAKANTKVASQKMVAADIAEAVQVVERPNQPESKVNNKKCCASAGCAKKM